VLTCWTSERIDPSGSTEEAGETELARILRCGRVRDRAEIPICVDPPPTRNVADAAITRARKLQ